MTTFSNHQSPRLLRSFCAMRVARVAREVHAFTRIPLRERQTAALEARMVEAVLGAASDDDVTARADAVQDAFAGEIRYRSPRMWRHCKHTATLIAMQLSLASVQPRGIRWRAHTRRVLCQRLFRAVMGAQDDDDVNARLQAVWDEALRA